MELRDLCRPFAADKVSWRVGSTTQDKKKGMALCYIDARDVQDRLDEVCGLDGWQCRYIPMHDKKTVCEIGIRVTPRRFVQGEKGAPDEYIPAEWVWKADGAGDTDVEAEKGALSDAFKRAAVRWGIGRYLYDVDSPWVELEPAGKSYKIAAKEYARLRSILGGSAAPRPAPSPEPAPKPNGSVAPSAPASEKKISPQQWGLQSIELVKTLGEKDLAAWADKHGAAMVKLLGIEPDIHAKLVATIRDREAEVGGPPF